MDRSSYRLLGRTGLSVSPLGLAALSVAGASRPRTALSADDVERAYYDLHVNTFLVHFMMPSLMEGVRRLIHAGHRADLVLISEVGIPLAGSVRRGLRKHLRLLRTDYLDAWLVGWVRGDWYLRPRVWEMMRALQQQGEIRAIGFSSHDRRLAATLAKTHDPDVLMIRYNAAHRGAEREVFAQLQTDRTDRPGVIAYTATRWGMLLQPAPAAGFATAMTASECYRFDLAQPAVDMAWCAAQSYQELQEDVIGLAAGPLSPERYEEVCRFGDAVHAAARGGRRWMFREPAV